VQPGAATVPAKGMPFTVIVTHIADLVKESIIDIDI
jgi:hypothetical protein